MPKNLSLSEFERCLTRYGLDLESWPNDAKLAALRLLDHNAQAQKIWRGEQVLRHYVPTLPALHPFLHDQTQNIALALAAQITNAHPRHAVRSRLPHRMILMETLNNSIKERIASASEAKQSRKSRHFNGLLDCFASLANAHFLFLGFIQTLLMYVPQIMRSIRHATRNWTRIWPQKRWSHTILGAALASVTLLLAGSFVQEEQNNLSPFDLSMSYLLSDYETVYYEENDILSLPEESQVNSLAVSLISLD